MLQDAQYRSLAAPIKATPLAASFRMLSESGRDGHDLLRLALREELRGEVALVSSFGADSVLLLAMVADIDPAVPVLFLDTDRHFPETLAYQRAVTDFLGLRDVRILRPKPREATAEDPDDALWYDDPDRCCALRKVRPLEAGLEGFSAWVTGRKRHQAATRARLGTVEWEAGRVKLNPLANWSASMVLAEIARRDLPPHPLVARGYPSIGCANCTRPASGASDSRAGRWSGTAKTECGIHRPS